MCLGNRNIALMLRVSYIFRVIENISLLLSLFASFSFRFSKVKIKFAETRGEIYPIHWISRTKWSMQKIRAASPVYKKSLKGITRRHWRSASRKTIFPSESTFSNQQLRLRSRDTRDLPWQRNWDRGGGERNGLSRRRVPVFLVIGEPTINAWRRESVNGCRALWLQRSPSCW